MTRVETWRARGGHLFSTPNHAELEMLSPLGGHVTPAHRPHVRAHATPVEAHAPARLSHQLASNRLRNACRSLPVSRLPTGTGKGNDPIGGLTL